ncbi:hypothetical protein FQA39_LY10149 [Lamprigera yunnana]|nr:hypothetical protein FQA39_LY10149 [Lamprigera yunnana]
MNQQTVKLKKMEGIQGGVHAKPLANKPDEEMVSTMQLLERFMMRINKVGRKLDENVEKMENKTTFEINKLRNELGLIDSKMLEIKRETNKVNNDVLNLEIKLDIMNVNIQKRNSSE